MSVLKELKIENFYSIKIYVTKVGQYTKDILYITKYFVYFKNNDNKIDKLYKGHENGRDLLFVRFKNDKVLKSYYVDGLDLI